MPGTTFAFPGTTFVFSTVIDRPTVVTTWATTEKGYTITTRGINIDDYALETTITMPGFTTTYSIPIPVYAETIRECSDVVVIYEETQILEKAPATLVFAIGFPVLSTL